MNQQRINGDASLFTAYQSFIKVQDLNHEKVINVIKDPKIPLFDEPTFARLNDVEFKNGEIEVKVYSRFLKDAPDFARGFIGIAFRINDNNTQFEGLYVRPSNGSCEDQIRRNHTVQYFSYPNYKFDDLRKLSPEKYETYAEIDMNEWIDLRIVVNDLKTELYINHSKHPVLIVHDLKNGLTKGGIGLWTEVGTDAYFKDLKVTSF